MAILTMYYSNLAKVNVGIITTIWSLNPLFLAVADYYINNQALFYYHYQGLFAILACSVIISLSGMIQSSPAVSIKTAVVKQAPTWVPVIFGIVTPIMFTANGILSKHLTSERINFNASTLSFTSYLLVNIVVLLVGIPYWRDHGFDQKLFWMGLIGSIVNTLGIVCI